MKIAIISDSHDNLANLEKVLFFLKKEKIKTIFHCGDICSPFTLTKLLEEFIGKVHIVFGNIDGDYFKTQKFSFEIFPQLKFWGRLGEIKIGGREIAFTHFPEIAKDLAFSQKYDIIFYGHTHKPWEEKIRKTRLVNPGNLAGLFYKATFAIYDTKNNKLDLKIL